MSNNPNGITPLNILDCNGNSLFDRNDKYVIPLYQRAFAWREKEICQLISDIEDFDGKSNYYLGTLIVFKKSDGSFEVIDGQQRLTAFFILLSCLGLFDSKPEDLIKALPLSFECREKSNKTLLRLSNPERLNEDEFEHSITEGKNIIEKEIKKDSFNKEEFKEKLKNVVIFRIEVPPHTDLNRYFEVMNTRGEQLEQHDVVKAKLMENLSDDKRERFALIWDACSDMDCYVQMNTYPMLRNTLFGGKWNSIPEDVFAPIKTKNNDSSQSEKTGTDSPISLKDIISNINGNIEYDSKSAESEDIRFESIIGFSHFLLHVLKVYVENNCTEETAKLISEQTDDKKLFDSFDSVINSGIFKDGKKISDNLAEFSESFIGCLLKCRFIFDKFIIKREYNKNDSIGYWSLKELDTSGQQSRKKAFYKNTYTDKYQDKTLMLQSCLRVSYVSAKSMHWITDLLRYLYGKISKGNIKGKALLTETDKVAVKAVKEAFFDESGKVQKSMGVNTQNIVFNYLDYLLWKEDQENKSRNYSDFVFEFRNSVEHWYPQHPSEESFDKWDEVDRFGNLCLIQRQINSKFSNLSPEAKNTTYPKMIAKGSIKLRIMANIIKDSGSNKWKTADCEKHENEMIDKLKTVCGIK